MKTKPVCMVIPFFMLLFPVLNRGVGDKPFLDYLKTRLQTYNSQYNSERAYLLTDRYVYRPGEDIWFKGFVSPVVKNSQEEDDFFIRLINANGDEIVYRRYPLNNHETWGHIAIPRSCIPGKYWLIAYSGWMKNQPPEEAFRKEILISKYFEKRFRVEINYDRSLYYPGDTVNALILIKDATGKPLSEIPFEYNLSTFKRTEFKGNGKTDLKGKAKVNAVVPETDDLLMINVEIRTRRISGDFSLLLPSFTGRPLISFFPEGGTLVQGIPSRIGVKSINRFGLAEPVKAVIVDASDNIIDTFQSNLQGVGCFKYVPGADSCYIKLLEPKGLPFKYVLPEAVISGTTIRYMGSKDDSAFIMIQSNSDSPITTFITALINRQLVWSSDRVVSDSIRIGIPIKDLPSGIMQISVFDDKHVPVAERTIKIPGHSLALAVKMDQNNYLSRQRVSVLVEYPQSLYEKNLALSVSLKKLALAPEEIPFSEMRSSLSTEPSDDELLVSDYRQLEWNEVLCNDYGNIPYRSQEGLLGTVYDKKDNISPHAKVRVTHFPNFRLYETQTDENGIFHVSFGSDVIDYRFLNIDAYDAAGKTSLNTRIDYSYVDHVREAILKENAENESTRVKDLVDYGEPDLVYVLRYGPGKFRKTGKDTHKKYDPFRYSRYSDVMDIIQDIKPYQLEDDKIIFTEPIGGNSDSAVMEEAILVINGVLKGNKIGALKNIIPSDITNINVSTSLFDVHKYTPLNFKGVIEITTIQGIGKYKQSGYQTSPGIINTSDKQFYSPDYSIENPNSADNRRTLYWNPKIEYHGNSMLVTFYTSDVKGTFYGHLTGTDQDGNPVEGEFTFEVE